jgi:hypothetical protein
LQETQKAQDKCRKVHDKYSTTGRLKTHSWPSSHSTLHQYSLLHVLHTGL